MSHNHERICCERCHIALFQCRCIEPKTDVYRGLCEKCQKVPMSHTESRENQEIAKNALFNRKYAEIIFRKCTCVPLANRESVDVIDMQNWFSLVQDNVSEALDAKDQALAELREEKEEVELALKRAHEVFGAESDGFAKIIKTLEARLAEACRVLTRASKTDPEHWAKERDNHNLLRCAMNMKNQAIEFLNSPTPPLQKSCEHDKGDHWHDGYDTVRFKKGGAFRDSPICPWCKPKEPDIDHAIQADKGKA